MRSKRKHPVQGLPLVAALPRPTAPVVRLGETTLTGLDLPLLGLEFFGGIPFAEPPLGELRFAPPVLKTNLGASSFDASNSLAYHLDANIDSEDCLTISILRPAGLKENAALPSMAFLHGGGFLSTAPDAHLSSLSFSTHIIQSGARHRNTTGALSSRRSIKRGTPIIYITFNYRLGAEAGRRKAVNLGLKDQLAALQWLQQRIPAFGGDNTKVTLFGESAGAISIAMLYFNSQLEHYIHGAIFESRGPATTMVFEPERRQPQWETFVTRSLACRRESATLLNALNTATSQISEQFPWVPVIDGELLPELPSNLLERGSFADVPYISGTTLDEGTCEALLNSCTTDRQYKRSAALFGDLMSQSQRRAWMQATSRRGVKAYGYLLTDTPPHVRPPIVVPEMDNGRLGGASLCPCTSTRSVFMAARSLPRPGVVLHLRRAPRAQGPADAVVLGTQMMDYWIAFATSLDPNDGRGAWSVWPAYAPESPVRLA
ncbi:Alpha/Beta hydrolase protein [Mycena sp. CBHHK59/15]|nr:Alpha/Beta hydrolase protein [Mycena sp. CBHHK59/15]